MDLGKAHALHQAGRLAEAEAAYLECIDLEPNAAPAHNLLGLLCLQTGRAQDAVRHIRRALNIAPGDTGARYNLALALIESKSMRAAEAELKTLLRGKPNHLEAMSALGNLRRLSGRAESALPLLQEARSMAPRHPGILLNLGLALRETGQLDDAAECLEQLVAISPSANACNQLGALKGTMGDAEDAVNFFKKAIALDEGHRDAWLNLGITLEQLGDRRGAVRVLRDALERMPDFASAYYQLMQVDSEDATDADIVAMRKLIGAPGTTPADRVLLHYGIGQAQDKRGHYADAFGAFEQAHRLKARSRRFDLESHLKRIDLLVNAFAEVAPLDIEHPQLVFIVGMPRSGTTLTEQILASHSRVLPLGERPFIGELAEGLTEAARMPFPQALDSASPADLLRLAARCRDRYLAHLAHLHHEPSKILIDTTPANYMLVGLIARIFPAARIVHTHRHPLDTCLSIYQYPLSDAHAYAHDLAQLGGTYAAYRRIMSHWRELLGLRLYDLQYERLTTSRESEIRALLGFCGLPFEPACLEFHRSQRRVRTPSASQVRRPIHQASVGRHKHYLAHLGPLMDALQ